MLKTATTLSRLSIAICFSMVLITCQNQEAPKVGLATTLIYDFGRVRVGTKITHEFLISNNSSKVIHAVGAKGSCTCTTLSSIPKNIQPGAEIPVLAELRTTGKSGKVEQALTVEFDNESKTVLLFRGEVEASFLASMDLGDFKRGDIIVRTFTLDWPAERDIQVFGISYDKNYLNVLQEKVSPTRQNLFRVEISRSVPFGAFTKTIAINTDDTLEPVKHVAIMANVLERVILEPKTLTLGIMRTGKESTGSIKVYSPYSEEFSIIESKLVAGQPVQCIWNRTSKTAYSMQLSATPPADYGANVFKSTIRVVAKSGMEEISQQVEIYGIVQPMPSISNPDDYGDVELPS